MKEAADNERFKGNHEGTITWRIAQQKAAAQGLAPDPLNEQITPLLRPELCDIPSHGAHMSLFKAEREESTRWFANNVAVYVVNLPQDMVKMKRFRKRAEHLRIAIRRVDGVALPDLAALDWAKRAGLVPKEYDIEKAKLARRALFDDVLESDQLKVGLGTVGCAAAALNAMQVASTESKEAGKPLAIIFEDDAWMQDDIAVKVHRLLQDEAPCDWEAISLVSGNPYGECVSPQLSRVHPDGNEPVERCRKGASDCGTNWRFTAMLYKVSSLDRIRARLADVVWDASMPNCIAQDVALASLSKEIAYYAVPGSLEPGFVDVLHVKSSRIGIDR